MVEMVSKIMSYLNKLSVNRILQTVLKKALQDKLEIVIQALSFTGSIGTTMLEYFFYTPLDRLVVARLIMTLAIIGVNTGWIYMSLWRYHSYLGYFLSC